jgi:hypothetical protein
MSKFYYYLSLILLFLLATSLLYYKEGHQKEIHWALQGINAFFVILGIILFEIGMVLGRSTNPFVFSRFFLMAVFFKMFIFVAIVMASILKFGLDKHAIVMPSLGMYLIYTIHETYFLMRISKQEPGRNEPNN